MESEPQSPRFQAFLAATEEAERDWIAFIEFEKAISDAAKCAGLINLYDTGSEGDREQDALELALSEMLFAVLPRVDLGVLIADVEGIGYALRYGIIEPKRQALDHIENDEDYQALAGKGYAADEADTQRRIEERLAERKTDS